MGPSSGERGEREETRRDTGGSRLGKKKERQRTAPRDKACNPVGEELLRKGGGGQLEEEFVVKVYDRIARHFSHTRYKPWPKVHAFLESLPRYSLVVDVGCGNGKYLQSLPQSQRRPLQDHLSSLSLHESSATISSKDPLASSSSPSPRLSSSSSSSSLSSSISDSSSSPPHHPGISNPSPTPSSFSASSVVSQAVLAGSDPGDCLVIGVDISIPLLEIACQRAHASGRVAAATCLNTNLREDKLAAFLSFNFSSSHSSLIQVSQMLQSPLQSFTISQQKDAALEHLKSSVASQSGVASFLSQFG
ncbi:methyltransferase domain-containing protein, partial [Cystoisospora suis]